MKLLLSDNSEAETQKDERPRNSREYWYIPFRNLNYRKQLNKWDTVFIQIEMMIGEVSGIVISNDGERIKVRFGWYAKSGRPLYRSFWVKNGLSCGPATACGWWWYDWLFYFMTTPDSFWVRINKIIDLKPEEISIISQKNVAIEDDIPF